MDNTNLPMKNPLPGVDDCQQPCHIFVAGKTSCVCGEVNYAEPPFPEDFWNRLDEAFADEDNGAVLDIARYCKVCGRNELVGICLEHDFDPDIPYDWNGK